MKKFFIYIIYSESADKYYVGYTSDVLSRLDRHNNPVFKSYTAKHIPWILKANIFIAYDRRKAMVIEKYIKKQKSRKFIESIILNQENSDFLEKLVRVPFQRD